MKEQLPYSAEAFEKLVVGRHISDEDAKLYAALQSNVEAYAELYEAVGYKLVHDHEHFFYFEGKVRAPSPANNRALLFVLIFSEWIFDGGISTKAGFFETTYPISGLPHLSAVRYQRLMAKGGVKTPDELMNVIKLLARFGMLRLESKDEAIRFLRPVVRLHRIVKDMATDMRAAGAADDAGMADDTGGTGDVGVAEEASEEENDGA